MTRDERMRELLYSNDGRVELCERMLDLEELIADMLKDEIQYCQSRPHAPDITTWEKAIAWRDGDVVRRARELGLEVD